MGVFPPSLVSFRTSDQSMSLVEAVKTWDFFVKFIFVKCSRLTAFNVFGWFAKWALFFKKRSCKRLYLSRRDWVNKEQLGLSDVMCHLHERPLEEAHTKRECSREVGFRPLIIFICNFFFFFAEDNFSHWNHLPDPKMYHRDPSWLAVDGVRVGSPELIQFSHLK